MSENLIPPDERPRALSEGGDAILDGSDALIAALIELERHVGTSGWDQAPRLFALVNTDSIIAADPELADRLGLRGSAEGGHPDALTAVEQDQFQPSEDLLEDLSAIYWPDTVHGCALSLESTFLPPGAEADIPDDPELATQYVSTHDDRLELRVVTGVDRAGHTHGVARMRSEPEELLGSPDMVPGLTEALVQTLTDPGQPADTDDAVARHAAAPDNQEQ
ncbi:PPA1309 family protein [Microlunatus sp. Gsoil 973]|uniref:PPA1309 family protein n=1 Tax=Microlunatus sp. Gsoil 973 TaxID=2672569 RepID=UPI0018A7F1C1|nr:PPA1309 family protein [Microlunatus sp. Gsoil 973]